MSDDLAGFLVARLDEDEASLPHAGAAYIAWLTYLTDDGQMGYTTVAARHGDWEPWVAGGKELPEPASVRVVYDPGRARREVAAKRAILAEVEAMPHLYVEDCYYSCELAKEPGDPHAEPGSGYCNDNWPRTGRCTCARDGRAARLLGSLAAIWSDHPDYRPEWKP